MFDDYSAIEASLNKLNLLNTEHVLKCFKDDQFDDEAVKKGASLGKSLEKYIDKPGPRAKFKMLFEIEYVKKEEIKNNVVSSTIVSNLNNLKLEENKFTNEVMQKSDYFPGNPVNNQKDWSLHSMEISSGNENIKNECEQDEVGFDTVKINEWCHFYKEQLEGQIEAFKANSDSSYLLNEQIDEANIFAMKVLAPEKKFSLNQEEYKILFLDETKLILSDKLIQNKNEELRAKNKAKDLKNVNLQEFRKMLAEIDHKKYLNVMSLANNLHSELDASIQNYEKNLVQLQSMHKEEMITGLKQSLNEEIQKCMASWIENKEFESSMAQMLSNASMTYKIRMDQNFENQKYYDKEEFENCHDEICKSVFILLESDLNEVSNTAKKEEALEKITRSIDELKNFYIDYNNANKPNPNAWIGIDLGTTYSSVSIYEKNKFVNIPIDGKPSIPSIVAYTNENNKTNATVGAVAAMEAFKYPRLTFSDAKRLLGKKMNDSTVQIDRKYWAFDISTETEKDDDLVKFVADYEDEKVLISPEEISAQVLLKLFISAIKYLENEKRTITGAVIGIPAGSSSQFKDATEKAVKLATDKLIYMGLLKTFDTENNLKFISEPVAVAYAYRPYLELGQKIFILDIGGGTLDITILKIGREVEVKCTSGNTHLGGQDIDNYIYTFVRNQYKESHGVDIEERKVGESLIVTKMRMSRLKWEIEKRKRDLSGEECPKAIKLQIFKFFQNENDFEFLLTREDLEKALIFFYQDMRNEIMKAIDSSQIDIGEINNVVLVGGTTNFPRIREVVRELFGDKKLHDKVNKELAVSFGAAFEAARANGELDGKCNEIREALPISFGVDMIEFETSKLIFNKILFKGTQLPVEATNKYTTTYPRQETVIWVVREGENEKEPEKNNKIGEFVLKGIPPNGNYTQPLTCKMSIDDKLKLIITATCVSNGKQEQIEIEVNRGGMSPEDYKNAERRVRLGAIDDFD